MHQTVLQPIENNKPNSMGFRENTFLSKTSAIVQPIMQTPPKENMLVKACHVTPHSRASTHVFTETPETVPNFVPYSHPVTRFVSNFRQPLYPTFGIPPQTINKSVISEDEIDVVNDSTEGLTNLPNNTDLSLSTSSTSVSPNGSISSSVPSPPGPQPESPVSETSSDTGSKPSPDQSSDGGSVVKKKVRTNYSPGQVQTLERIFHENPYPDSDMMEDISKDLGVAENKIKIWFQNKRARWRRRMNDNVNRYQSYVPISPILSPVTHFGMMPQSPMMTSSPQHMLPGFMPVPLPVSTGNQNSYFQNTPPSTLTRIPTKSRHDLLTHPQFVARQHATFFPAKQNINLMTTQSTMTTPAGVHNSTYAPRMYPYHFSSINGNV